MQTKLERSVNLRTLTWLSVYAFLAIAALFLWGDHRSHILGVVPYLLLLACPIIHLLMHQSHGGDGRTHREVERRSPEREGGRS